jgi:DNA-binding transcriptional ArsR family regulator
MRWGRAGAIPAVLFVTVVLLTTAAAGGLLADLDRADDGSRVAWSADTSQPTFADDVLPEETATVGTADRPPTSIVDRVSDRLSTPSDRVAAPDWSPPVALLLFGYSRQADGSTLENDLRERIFDHVRSAPGAHIAAIADGTDVPRSTVRYHLRVLEGAGLIVGATIRGRHRYAPAETDLELAAALHDEPTRAVLEAVGRFEPVSVSGIADEIDRAPSTVAHHLDQLEEAGLLTRERSNGTVDVSLEGLTLDPSDDRSVATTESDPRAQLPAE